MPGSSSFFLKAFGLNVQPNALDVPQGSLIDASNVIVRRDNVIESRRGFKLYGTPMGTSSDVAKQLMEYRGRIIRHYSNVLQFDTLVLNAAQESIFATFAGNYSEVEPGLRIKSIEANNNLYFTTSDGIKKISSVDGNGLVTDAGFITNAGGIKALDIQTSLVIDYGSSTGFFPVDATVAYRVVWGIKDANGNVILGTPSSRSVIYNPLLQMDIRDYMQMLYALDQLNTTGSYYNDGDYVSSLGLGINATAQDLKNNLVSLTEKLDTERGTLFSSSDIKDAFISNGILTIAVAQSTAAFGKVATADTLYLNGFTGTNINGPQTVTNLSIDGVKEVTQIMTTDTTSLPSSGTAAYFNINTANDAAKYYVWYSLGTSTDPAVAGRTGLQVTVLATDTSVQVAEKTSAVLAAHFTSTYLNNIITVTNTNNGITTDAVDVTTGFTITVLTQGVDLSVFITFDTTLSGDIGFSTASITSGSFRGIAVPDDPSLPSTHNDAQNLQNYILAIITELQSTNNVNLVADNLASPNINPLEITTAAVTGTTTLTINFDTSVTNTDARNQFKVGDLISLDGTWTATGGSNISGLQTVASVAAGNITVTLGTPVLNGGVTIDSTSIIDRIQRFTDVLQAEFITPLQITTTANVLVTIDIPPDVTTSNFYQIYRSDITVASGTDILADLFPDDEMKLVYENFPTQAEIDAGFLSVEDVVPDSFIQGATNLYTNQNSGEGILQSNDVPPLAHDITVFKNYTWYANTKTRHRKEEFLLGVQGIINDFNNNLHPVLDIGNSTINNRYTFVGGVQEVTNVTTVAGGSLASSGTASYFLLNNANNATSYYVWYSIGTATDPMIAGKTGIEVFALAGDTNVQIANKTSEKLNTIVDDFTASVAGHTVTITNVDEGPSADASAGTSGFTVTVMTQGAGENIAKEITNITCIAGSLYVTAGTADYFTLNTPFDRQLYAFWFNVTGGAMIAPVLSGRTVIPISVLTTDTNAQVATKVSNAILAAGFWTTSVNSNVVTTTTDFYGPTKDATEVVANPGFTVAVTQQGALDVLLSNSPSPSIAVQETSLSLTKAVNLNNKAEIVNAFYLSGATDTPGDILFEEQRLSDIPFYLLTNTTGTGNSFNPQLSPTITGITNTAANPTVVTATGHTLQNGDQVMISGSNSFPLIDGVFTVSNVIAGVSFTIPVNVITAGTAGSLIPLIDAEVSSNEVKPNRIYYSKLQQPEAVPIVNFLDVGSANKQILRIFPLRDSLFVFKEEGLYRISGETPPWTLALFDANTKLIAADSLSSSNNLLYCWSKQGIVTVSEAGAQLISRPIDTLLLPISSSSQFTNFSTLTWGIGYDSDNSYYVYTVKKITDAVATICYRYSNLTNTWTTYDKTNTCGIIYSVDDKLYMGAGDTNFLEQERKDFARTDYADRQYPFELFAGNYFQSGASIKLENSSIIEPGDVITQDQTLTVYTYNQLLKKLDFDDQVGDDDYFATLEAKGGDNMRTKLEQLAEKLDADIGLSNIKTFVPGNVNTGTDTITITAHEFLNNQAVKFSSTGTLPGGLNSTDYFYIINATANTFKVSATEGGSAVNITTTGSGVHTIEQTQYQYAIIERTNYPITSNAIGNPTVVTSTNHGLETSRQIIISNVTGSNPTINGEYLVTRIDANHFSIAVDVLTAGTGGTFTTDVENFIDIESSFNIIIGKLNADSGAAFANYSLITDNTIQEAIVTSVNSRTGIITLLPKLEFVVGPLTVYKHITSTFTYSPATLGDPVRSKQLYEATIMFSNKTFTSAVMSFSTDLLPEFIDVPFNGLGNGIFGHQDFGTNFFGGDSHSAPFRTYVPRQCQRCRFINIKFVHATAREKYSIYGISLTGRVGLSSRAYK